MNREVHVRICEGWGLRCPRLLGSDEEKAHVMRQVGARKTIIVEASESGQTASEPGRLFGPGMSLVGVGWLAGR